MKTSILKIRQKVFFFNILNNLHSENTVLTKRINKINKCYLAVNNLASPHPTTIYIYIYIYVIMYNYVNPQKIL